MTQLLPRLLRLAEHAGPMEKRAIIESLPQTLGVRHDGKLVPARELLLSESIESTTLIQSEVYKTIVEGARLRKSARDFLPVYRCNSNTLDIITGENGAYASKVAEGAEIPVHVQDYSKTSITVDKYGERPLITRELVDDGLFDIVAAELSLCGERLENALNREAIYQLTENAGLEHDTGGSNQGIDAIATARGKVNGAGFYSTEVVMHPEMVAIVLKDFTPTTGYYQVGDTTKTGNVPPLLGLQAHECGVTNKSGATYTWDYDGDSDIGGLVIEKAKAGAIAMRQDIRVEKYNDPVRDLVGLSATMRFGVGYLHANAICRIEY